MHVENLSGFTNAINISMYMNEYVFIYRKYHIMSHGGLHATCICNSNAHQGYAKTYLLIGQIPDVNIYLGIGAQCIGT